MRAHSFAFIHRRDCFVNIGFLYGTSLIHAKPSDDSTGIWHTLRKQLKLKPWHVCRQGEKCCHRVTVQRLTWSPLVRGRELERHR